MKKLCAAILLFTIACVIPFAVHAGPNDVVLNQRNPIDNGNIVRYITAPTVQGTNCLFYFDYSGAGPLPGCLALGAGLSLSSGVLSAPPASTYTFDFGQPAARTVAASTVYQALSPSKAALVSVSPSCTAALSLTAGGTCTLTARIGAAGLTCATGTPVATWTNANTGTLTVGLGLNQTIGSPYAISLPAGAYFILCPTSGTFTISAAEQTVG